MCGIWGILGSKITCVDVDKFLTDACSAGTVRGAHGTGVFHVYHDKQAGLFANYHKDAVDGTTFSQAELGRKIITTASNSLCVVGHNRYATGGGYEAQSAHPFRRGAVTLVHNGVLDNQYQLLKEYNTSATAEEVSVDSDAIAVAMAADEDPVQVLERLRGAYTLVWFDERTGLVNFARNEERPLNFAVTDKGTAFASESGMLGWLCARHGLKIQSTGELPVGVLVQAGQDGKDFCVVNKQAFKAAPRVRSYGGVGGYGGYVGYDDYPWPVTGGSNTASGAQAGSSISADTNKYNSAGSRINSSGHTYAQVVDEVKQHLATRFGLHVGKQAEFSITGYKPRTTTQVSAELCMLSQNQPYVRAVKYIRPDPSDNTESGRLKSFLDSSLENYLNKHWEDVHTVVCTVSAVVLTSMQGSEWSDHSTEEIINKCRYRVYVSGEDLKCVEFDPADVSVNVVGYDSSEKEAQFRKNRATTSSGLVKDATYVVKNIPAHVLNSTFRGNPAAKFLQYSRIDGSMAVVQPISNPRVTLLQPIASLVPVQ